MREIKFRGQRKDNKEWIYGFIVIKRNELNPDEFKHFDEYFIYDKNEECYFKIIPETIGQFTGLKDKNGKEIYEKDIIKDTFKVLNTYPQKYRTRIIEIEYCDFGFAPFHWFYDYEIKERVFEIIGNKIENPKLLGETI